MKTKKKYYAVLWIPTKTHRPVTASPIQRTITRNISDIEGSELYIEAVLQDNFDIDISILEPSEEASSFKESTQSNPERKGQKNHFLTLVHIDHSHNGLVEYCYEESYLDPNNPSGLKFTDKEFPEAIYHIIKEFYHKHEFHDAENDTDLSPFISDTQINLKENDNPALKHYLERYETVLNDLIKPIQRARDILKHKHIMKNYSSFGKLILKAKGYEVYLNVLYGSIYNTKCKLGNNYYQDAPPYDPDGHAELTETQKDMRRRAFNIENLINYFEACGQEFNINVQQHNLMEQIRNTFFALIITFISTVIGVGVTVYTANQSTQDLLDKKKEIIQTVDSTYNSLMDRLNAPSLQPKTQVANDKRSRTDSHVMPSTGKKPK